MILSTSTVAALALAGSTLGGVTSVGPLDVVNDALGGTPGHSNGGLDAQNFTGVSSGTVSVFLRSRPVVGGLGQPSVAPATSGTATGLSTYGVGDNGQFTVDFQLTPGAGATLSDNFFLSLEIDNDSGVGTNFAADNIFAGKVFDADSDDELLDDMRFGGSAVPAVDASWDDGDSVVIDGVTTRGGSTVDFGSSVFSEADLPAYVVSNSWNAQWDFPNFSLLGDDFGGDVAPGLYDVRLTVSGINPDGSIGSAIASVEITAEVVPAPSGLAVLSLCGLTAMRRRRGG